MASKGQHRKNRRGKHNVTKDEIFNAILGKKYNDRVIENSTIWTEVLLEKFHTAVVPGIEFGAEGYIRLSFATSMDIIQKGITRIKEAVASLQ